MEESHEREENGLQILPLFGIFSNVVSRFADMLESATLDEIDRKILTCLQTDATMALETIAAHVGLSASPCWRRIQKLEAAGVIRARVALLDPEKMNVAVTVFVAVRTSRHNVDWAERFCRAVRDIPEVIEFYRMSGETDYLLRVVVPDIKAYDAVYQRLIKIADLFDVSSNFAMESIKYTTALPTHYAR